MDYIPPCSLFSSPVTPPSMLLSALWVEDLATDPDPTDKRMVDNQLPFSSSLNQLTSVFLFNASS